MVCSGDEPGVGIRAHHHRRNLFCYAVFSSGLLSQRTQSVPGELKPQLIIEKLHNSGENMRLVESTEGVKCLQFFFF